MSGEFHALHHGGNPLLLPNVWDVGTAEALAEAGFRAVATTSFGIASSIGVPNGAGRTRAHVVALVRRLAALPCLLTVDVEGGFSDDPGEVADLAVWLADLGVVGINLEDGAGPGRLVDAGLHAAKVAEVRARVPRLFVNARVDTYWVDAERTISATLARAERYRDAGADGIFVPGRLTAPEIADLVNGIGVPLNVLWYPGSHGVAELAALGVKRISTGSQLYRAARRAAVDLARELADGFLSG
ncbi:isocitrate lyase/phosphoenolpyruvate mutase family protein [Saccharomonospora xinjiangensis]|uniref:isocitrate lyase/PEP mutase family protein n=1 Tax=Saccharomonospora xinjiangensis TaxID=75294 RepID=UPI00350E9222